jgi:nicotinamide phosphoribosyltransferase
MENRTNIILNTDSYKASHYRQYSPEVKYLSSYIESRGGEYDKTVFFGLQAFIERYLLKPISLEDIEEAGEVLTAHGLPFNKTGWYRILTEHGGYLPLSIEAAPEGTVIGTHNVLIQAVNTDPEMAWLTSYIETALLRAVWYPTTVATVSWHIKQEIRTALEETADNADGLLFKLHDFGARGASSLETAGIGGAAHLINFRGTDTLEGILFAREYYGEPMAGFSIPAAEHSTITSWGREGELQAYENMLAQYGKKSMFAVVCDSYDLFNAIKMWGGLKDKLIESGGTVVIRPDSGDPVDIVCKTVEALMEAFGHTVNSKGYKVLPSYVKVIQGDGISAQMIRSILTTMRLKNLSADNVAFGMGAELLQKVNRDTLKFAMKASAVSENLHEWKDVYKDPITDPGKRSKRGRLVLIDKDGGGFKTERAADTTRPNRLRVVYRNGKLLIVDNFKSIRERSEP